MYPMLGAQEHFNEIRLYFRRQQMPPQQYKQTLFTNRFLNGLFQCKQFTYFTTHIIYELPQYRGGKDTLQTMVEMKLAQPLRPSITAFDFFTDFSLMLTSPLLDRMDCSQ